MRNIFVCWSENAHKNIAWRVGVYVTNTIKRYHVMPHQGFLQCKKIGHETARIQNFLLCFSTPHHQKYISKHTYRTREPALVSLFTWKSEWGFFCFFFLKGSSNFFYSGERNTLTAGYFLPCLVNFSWIRIIICHKRPTALKREETKILKQYS